MAAKWRVQKLLNAELSFYFLEYYRGN